MAGVALGLALLAALALVVAGHLRTPIPADVSAWVLRLVGAAFVLRALVPTPWTGFFKTIRATRWARFDTYLYSPLFLILGSAVIAVAAGY